MPALSSAEAVRARTHPARAFIASTIASRTLAHTRRTTLCLVAARLVACAALLQPAVSLGRNHLSVAPCRRRHGLCRGARDGAAGAAGHLHGRLQAAGECCTHADAHGHRLPIDCAILTTTHHTIRFTRVHSHQNRLHTMHVPRLQLPQHTNTLVSLRFASAAPPHTCRPSTHYACRRTIPARLS